jgi:ABC-type transport system involved in cytochrome c biogenesis permease subunit
MPLTRITIFCFGASYAVALALELLQVFWPRRVQRLVGQAFGAAGLLAHTLFLAFHPPSLLSRFGSMLFLAWILAVFYLYGSIHHRRLVWGVFVLPVVLGLVVLAAAEPTRPASGAAWFDALDALRGFQFWGLLHFGLLLLAAVGVCVGFVASLMYLVQARRLKAKAAPGRGLRLPSLERLEEMNRRAINLAFPLLTAGVVIGLALMLHRPAEALPSRLDPKMVATGALWLLFVLLLCLRYAAHFRGRRLALLTIVAFGLLLVTLAAAHSSVPGGGP